MHCDSRAVPVLEDLLALQSTVSRLEVVHLSLIRVPQPFALLPWLSLSGDHITDRIPAESRGPPALRFYHSRFLHRTPAIDRVAQQPFPLPVPTYAKYDSYCLPFLLLLCSALPSQYAR